MSKITQYILRIKNPGKRRYAHDFLKHARGSGKEPAREIYGISYMAAQAVRMHINELLKEEAQRAAQEKRTNL